ncbi:hypothetical protein Tco_0173615 [Tanacetum coccineum]
MLPKQGRLAELAAMTCILAPMWVEMKVERIGDDTPFAMLLIPMLLLGSAVNLASTDAGFKAKAVVGSSINSDIECKQQVSSTKVLQALT